MCKSFGDLEISQTSDFHLEISSNPHKQWLHETTCSDLHGWGSSTPSFRHLWNGMGPDLPALLRVDIFHVAPFLLSISTRSRVLCFFFVFGWILPQNGDVQRIRSECSQTTVMLTPKSNPECFGWMPMTEGYWWVQSSAILLSLQFDMLTSSEYSEWSTMLRNAWRRPKRFFKQRSPWVWKPSLHISPSKKSQSFLRSAPLP